MSAVRGVRAFPAGALTRQAREHLDDLEDLRRHRGPDGPVGCAGAGLGLARTPDAARQRAHWMRPVHCVEGRWGVALDGVPLDH